ncbi:MAG: molybdopterin-guanine dinucleotide biosynthesis protein MobA [Saprospirales bacterium]|nr:molybdopterin-guanine dinucleotide biosynthesis protein MobA [Saprospirales bacterium]
MSKKKHRKHEDLARPDLGVFHRNEWAFIGAPCGLIRKVVFALSSSLAAQWKCGYVDADHAAGDSGEGADDHGVLLEYTDKINFHRYDTRRSQDTYHWRNRFAEMDMVFVNGNHFKANRQVVIVHPKKLESLERKLDRLTCVELVLLADGMGEVPAFLKSHLGEADVPVLKLEDTEALHTFFAKRMQERLPGVKGMVLAGGRSRRMKQDKSLIEYHGVPQRDYTFGQMRQCLDEVFMSCRPEQGATMMLEYPLVVDTYLNLGPMGAILSAFRQDPNSAWLVVACDLPLLDAATIGYLLKNRNPSAIATAFRSPVDEFPEPLIAIWEPKAYPALLSFLAQGFSCPRKVLINSPVELLTAPDPMALRNANTPEEAVEIARLIAERGKEKI